VGAMRSRVALKKSQRMTRGKKGATTNSPHKPGRKIHSKRSEMRQNRRGEGWLTPKQRETVRRPDATCGPVKISRRGLCSKKSGINRTLKERGALTQTAPRQRGYDGLKVEKRKGGVSRILKATKKGGKTPKEWGKRKGDHLEQPGNHSFIGKREGTSCEGGRQLTGKLVERKEKDR